MTLKFDHFVHFTASPEEALATFAEHGLHAVAGGRHEDFGTYNALSYFGLSYVELIGVFDFALAKEAGAMDYSLHSTFLHNQYADGAQRIALRSSDLEALASHLMQLGYEVNGPISMSRTRTDGSVLAWKLLFAGKPGESFPLPFFIEWGESDEVRFADLKERGIVAPHPHGEITVDGVAIAVPSIEAVIDDWAAALQLEKSSKTIDTAWNATAQRLHLEGGDIIFYEPNGDGIVQDTINAGRHHFALQLNSHAPAQISINNAIYRFI